MRRPHCVLITRFSAIVGKPEFPTQDNGVSLLGISLPLGDKGLDACNANTTEITSETGILVNDRERLTALKGALSSLDGMNAVTFERLMTQISQSSQPFGYDSEGKLRVAFFDANPRSDEIPSGMVGQVG